MHLKIFRCSSPLQLVGVLAHIGTAASADLFPLDRGTMEILHLFVREQLKARALLVRLPHCPSPCLGAHPPNRRTNPCTGDCSFVCSGYPPEQAKRTPRETVRRILGISFAISTTYTDRTRRTNKTGYQELFVCSPTYAARLCCWGSSLALAIQISCRPFSNMAPISPASWAFWTPRLNASC